MTHGSTRPASSGSSSGTPSCSATSAGASPGPRIQDVAWISYLHEVKTPDADWFELAIIHHTDCGSGFFADPELRRGFAQRGFDEQALAELPVLHPAETVRIDVERLAREPSISPRIKISGYSYDVKTGLLTAVIPALLGDEEAGREDLPLPVFGLPRTLPD